MAGRRSYSIFVRGLLLALLLLALWNPRPPWQAAPIDLLVLVDASASLDAAARDRNWQQLTAGARRLPAGSRLALLRFGAAPVVERDWRLLQDPAIQDLLVQPSPPAHLAVADSDTDLAAALQAGLRQATPGHDTRLVLLTDGRSTRGAPEAVLNQAHAAGLPVYFLDASAPRAGDSWVAALQAPARLPGGQRLPVTVTLASQAQVQGRLQLLLDGEAAATRTVSLSPQQPTRIALELPPPAGRSVTLEARLEVAQDPEPRNNRLAQIINLSRRAPLLYVSRDGTAPALAQSLLAGGWELQLTRPAGLPAALAAGKAGAIVLDDIAIADLPETDWQHLIHQVTHAGTGLLVLGGPHAFAAGGYRHSALEGILPVTAEAREPQPPAAVFFLLDTSGSMDRRDGGPSRLAVARQAMLETARRLQPGDATGLLEFAAEPRLVLPLAVQRDPVAALGADRRTPPAGGTRLEPALAQAVTQLAGAGAEQRLLVLVTDGHVDDLDFDRLAPRIEAAHIDVIALAIGADADTGTLARLTALNAGRLLRVDRVAELPSLMRRELDQRRPLLESGHFRPRVNAALPFLPQARDWPPLERYWVTRERDDAQVYLQVQGDPLLAAHFAGAGRVATLATALDDWSAFWQQWPDAGAFAGGLPDWLDARQGATDLHLEQLTRDGETLLRLETTPDMKVRDAHVRIEGPDGRVEEIPLEAQAPDRYEARPTVTLAGRYQAQVRIGEQQLSHSWLHQQEREFLPQPEAAAQLRQWLAEGLLQPWPQRLQGTARAAGDGGLRGWLLMLTLLGYGLLLVAERRGDLFHTAWQVLTSRVQRGGSTSPAGRFRLFRHEGN